MRENVINGLMGALGGLAKSIFGAIKAVRKGNLPGNSFEFNIKMTLVTLVEGAVGGLILGYVAQSPMVAFLGGAGINELADMNDLLFVKTS